VELCGLFTRMMYKIYIPGLKGQEAERSCLLSLSSDLCHDRCACMAGHPSS
jgi:hypothetical protein